jgi:enoyl-CoA hydratase/carnithine racemase
MSYEQIRYAVADRIATITLNRPEKLNAYTAQMGSELTEAFDAADADDEVRCVIVTGAGRGFCAGADISGGADTFDTARNPKVLQRREDGGWTMRIFNCRKPVIGAINGPAVGVGATMTLPFDIRLAATSARFGFVFARLGLVPEAGSAWFLPRLVGVSQALRWIYSGRIFDAEEALRGGLVSEIHDDDRLLPAARAIAAEMVERTSPVAVALARQMIWRLGAETSPEHTLQVDLPLTHALGASAEVKEGVAASRDKRLPTFPFKVSTDMPAPYPWWTRD